MNTSELAEKLHQRYIGKGANDATIQAAHDKDAEAFGGALNFF